MSKTVEEKLFLAALDIDEDEVERLSQMMTEKERRYVLDAFVLIKDAFFEYPPEKL